MFVHQQIGWSVQDRVGHRNLFHSERIVLLRSFLKNVKERKERKILLQRT